MLVMKTRQTTCVILPDMKSSLSHHRHRPSQAYLHNFGAAMRQRLFDLSLWTLLGAALRVRS